MLAVYGGDRRTEDSSLQPRQRRDAEFHAAPVDVSAAVADAAGHEVMLIDGNTQPMTDAELVQFALDKGSVWSASAP